MTPLDTLIQSQCLSKICLCKTEASSLTCRVNSHSQTRKRSSDSDRRRVHVQFERIFFSSLEILLKDRSLSWTPKGCCKGSDTFSPQTRIQPLGLARKAEVIQVAHHFWCTGCNTLHFQASPTCAWTYMYRLFFLSLFRFHHLRGVASSSCRDLPNWRRNKVVLPREEGEKTAAALISRKKRGEMCALSIDIHICQWCTARIRKAINLAFIIGPVDNIWNLVLWMSSFCCGW